MTELRNYIHCNIAGHGTLKMESSGRKQKFRLAEMSAEGMRIITERELGIGQIVQADIRVESVLFEVKISAIGSIKNNRKRNEKDPIEYEVEFLNLPEEDKEAINQLMIDTCDCLQ